MIRLPPRSTRTDTLFPYTTLFRAKRKRCSMCIEQSQIIPLGSDKDVIKVAITEQLPQAGLECAIGREYLQCFRPTEGKRRIGSIEKVKTGPGKPEHGRLPEARAGHATPTKQGTI